MRKENGFTLIELLAVIVILAIIALISTPLIINLIEDAKKRSFLASCYNIAEAGKLYYTENLFNQKELEHDVIFSFPSATKLKIGGKEPTSGSMRVSKTGKITLAVSDGVYCARKGYDDAVITVTDDLENCDLLYDETILNGASPDLKDGLIAVTIDEKGVVRKANLYDEWYSYNDKKWANAVTVTKESRNKYNAMKSGEVIDESDILTYLVWIPRYKYRLWNAEPKDNFTSINNSVVHSIDIVFEDKATLKSVESSNGKYLTHPAFTLNEELDGFWVGKFETGYNGATTVDASRVVGVDPSKVIIKPSTINNTVYSWLDNNISNMYYTALGMNDDKNVFGLTNDSDPHMMKNTEWGAVAYLSHSKYGTCTDEGCEQIYINNNNTYMTGCGGDSAGEKAVAECKNQYGTKEDGIYNQSTTGNITGIFDMNGGTYELVMAFSISDSESYDKSGFTKENFPDDAYIDIYTTTTSKQYSNRILGDATGELGPFASYKSSWYTNYAYYLYTKIPWLGRGGFYSQGNNAGIFSFGNSLGNAYSTGSTFRIVIG